MKVNEDNKTVTFTSETEFKALAIGTVLKDIGTIVTLSDDTGKTDTGYFIISHFTHTTKTSKGKTSKGKTSKAPSKETKKDNTPAIRELRIQEIQSTNSFIEMKCKDGTIIRLVEIPTMILDIALMIRDKKDNPAIAIDKDRLQYVKAYVKGYINNKAKSYTRNCTLAGKDNIDKAIAYINKTL